MTLAPKLAFFFMLVLLVALAYAAIDFRPRQFGASCLLYGASTAIVLLIIRDRVGYPGVSAMEIALLWLSFLAAMACMVLASARFSGLRNKLSDRNRQLRDSLLQIEELASRDHLTGALNRRKFMELLEGELQRTDRTGQPFCLVILDLDHFKRINDDHGHPMGDAVLAAMCETMSQALRTIDRVGRLGGEEFAILLPATMLPDGLQVTERLRAVIIGHDWESLAPGLSVRFSAGISVSLPGDTLQAIIKRADDALYHAKRMGRDQVSVTGAAPADAILA
jgi:diguanylate cyclase (GGDEF)-like protein